MTGAFLNPEIRRIEVALARRPRSAAMFRACFLNTLETTCQPQDDGTAFVITGDIPALWLRDSNAQVTPYLRWAGQHPELRRLVEGLVLRQARSVLLDPYANAFNLEPRGAGFPDDKTDHHPYVWERKYEVDSLCAPIHLAYKAWKIAGLADVWTPTLRQATLVILDLWETEQDHEARSPYRFERFDCPPTDTLVRQGKGSPVAVTGLTWSGFRPSDDACTYGYLVPANMYAAVVLDQLAEGARSLWGDEALALRAEALGRTIRKALDRHAQVDHAVHGRVWAYEVDGRGNHLLMDDANVPSLLSIPYLGFAAVDDPVYRNTRALVLSATNPFYYEGRAARGVGSPHTPARYLWPIGLAMQALTSTDPAEVEACLDLLETTDAGTGLMHESLDVDDPTWFTRPWFAWANSLFAELLIRYAEGGLPSQSPR